MPSAARNLANLLGGSSTIPVEKLSSDLSTIEQVSSTDALTASGNTVGDQRVVGNNLYIWNGSGWFRIALINETPTWDSGGQPLSSYELDADSPQDATVITLAASDPDGLPITYTYVTGGSMDSMATISQDSSVFTITPKTVTEVGEGVELTGSITFRASDGVNILPQVSSFTLSFVFLIENSKYTTLLATAVDTSDNSITDSSTNNYTISVNQSTNVSAGTFSPYRHGGYSWDFEGGSTVDDTAVGAAIVAQSTGTDFNVGTNDYSIECWFKHRSPTTYNTNPNFRLCEFNDIPNGGSNDRISLQHNNVGNISVKENGSTVVTTTSTPCDGEWHFIQVIRTGGTTAVYIDGTQEASASSSTNIGAISRIVVGAWYEYNYGFDGQIADFRFSNIARTAGTPTERLTSDSNTKLLVCSKPYFVDESGTATSLYLARASGATTRPEPTSKPFGPYDNLEYSASDHGGSVSMPNDNDYLSVPHSSTLKPSGTDPFCVSFWYYPTTSPGTTRQLVGDANYVSYPTNCPGWDILYQSGSQLDVRWGYPNYADMASGKTNSTVQVNAWNHIAFCRSGGSLSYYLNGKRCNTTTSNINISASGLANFYVGYAGESTGTAMNSAMGTIADFKYEVGTSQFDATASTITIPTAPQSTTNSVLHIKGSDVSFIDKSQGANIGLIGPGTGTSTESPFAGGKSLDLTSTTETYVYVDGDSIVINANEAFTFEFWMKYVGQRGGSGTCIFDWGIHSGDGNVALFRQNTGGYKLHITGFGGFSNYSTAYDSLEDGTWKHFALSRTSSGDVKSFIDGSVIESSTGYTLSVADRADTAKKLRIGGLHNYNAYGIKMYIQDAKITRGLAKYTANFTPPTESFKA